MRNLRNIIKFAPALRSVAQLVEHVTLNHGVEGSSPSGPTKGRLYDLPFCIYHSAVGAKSATRSTVIPFLPKPGMPAAYLNILTRRAQRFHKDHEVFFSVRC
jgi:hypothetical protein